MNFCWSALESNLSEEILFECIFRLWRFDRKICWISPDAKFSYFQLPITTTRGFGGDARISSNWGHGFISEWEKGYVTWMHFGSRKSQLFGRKHGEFWRISGSKAWWFQDTLVGERGIQLSGGCHRGDATAGDVEEQLHLEFIWFQWFYEISLQSSWITRWWVQGFSKSFGNFHWENLMTRSILTSITVDGQNPAPVGRVKTPI